MVKKKQRNLMIFLILGVAIAIGVFYFFPSGTTVPPSTSQGGLETTGCVSDSQGNCLTTISPFATVTFEGEEPTVGAKYITIFSTLTPVGNVPFIEVNSIAGNPPLYNTEIQSDMLTVFTLNQGETDEQTVTFDITDESIPLGLTTYEMSISASFKDAQGNVVPVSPQPVATLSISKEKDTCDDSTPWGDCSEDKPKFCEPGTLNDDVAGTTYTQGQLVDKASVCGCPVDQIPNPTNPDECILDACIDGTLAGQCVSPTPGDTNTRFCNINRELEEACNQCGCINDFYGNPSTGCSVEDTCEYTEYTGDLDITIGSGGGAPLSTVKFRTNNLAYSSGAIAYTTSCGSELESYGFETSTEDGDNICETGVQINPGGINRGSLGTYIMNVPGTVNGVVSPSGSAQLYLDQTDEDEVWICQSDGGTDIRVTRYDAGDSDASSVSTSGDLINSNLEVAC